MLTITENKERKEVIPSSFVYDLCNIRENYSLNIEVYDDEGAEESDILGCEKRRVKIEFDVYYPSEGFIDKLYENANINTDCTVVETHRYWEMVEAGRELSVLLSKKTSWWNKILNWFGYGE